MAKQIRIDCTLEEFEKMTGKFCDEVCRYITEIKDPDELIHKYCDRCPAKTLNDLADEYNIEEVE